MSSVLSNRRHLRLMFAILIVLSMVSGMIIKVRFATTSPSSLSYASSDRYTRLAMCSSLCLAFDVTSDVLEFSEKVESDILEISISPDSISGTMHAQGGHIERSQFLAHRFRIVSGYLRNRTTDSDLTDR